MTHNAHDVRSPVVRAVLSVSFIDALGSGIFLAAAPVLAVRGLGHAEPLVGLALGLSGLAGLLSSVPLGRLSDRLNPRATLIGMHIARGLAVASFGFATPAWGFVVLLVLLGAAEGGVSPLMQSLIAGHLSTDDRVRRMAQVRVARNIGFGGGSLIAAGVMLGAPGPAAVVVGAADAISFLASAALLRTIPRWSAGRRSSSEPAVSLIGKAPSRRTHRARIILIGIMSGAVSVHVTVLTVALPLWITQGAELPPSFAPVLITLNAVIVILVQVRLSERLRARPPSIGLFSAAALPLGASFLVFLLHAGLPTAVLLAAAWVRSLLSPWLS